MAKFIRFLGPDGPTYGRVEDDVVYTLSGDLFGWWEETGEGFLLDGLKLLPPCSPGKMLAVGFNYRDHAEEFHTPIPTDPNIFLKPPSCLAAHGQKVLYPRALTRQVEYEAELVVVIGRHARHVTPEQAPDYILGYTVGNDVTARDLQSPTGQWALCKGFDTFGPIGPCIVTDVDPRAGLEIESFVNGERKQHSNTRNLIFDPFHLVSYLSQALTLEPGDVIFTGTPSGVSPVHPGDVMEMRIQGIKTNISFLINVVNNPTFQAGECYTTFIEETPELFDLTQRTDRASKILDFLGDKIVNVSKGEKPYFEDRVLPKYDETALVYGAKDEFKKLGAKGFTQKILGEKRLYVTDTSMRDAQQSLIATRMRTKDIVGAAKASNVIFQNAFSVEAWGGATYDTAYRFLKESPWKRLEILSERMPNTLIQMLLRASNAVGYSNYPDNLVKEFIRISAIKGIDVFRIFDSLNWIENMKMPIEEALKTGKIVEGSLCYTGDILSPNEVKYTLDYYVEKAKELESLGVHILAIKDMAGLLKPYAAQKLVETLKSELHIPIHLHTHDTTGAGVATVLKAAEAGVDIADLAIESMSSCTSQPSLNVVVEALRGTERDTGLDFEGLDELSRYYEHVRKVYKANESGMVSPNAQIYKYEIPGGQYSNLLAQVTEMGSKDEFEKIKELYRQANDLLGNLIKVTPTSKVVGDLAIFMLKNGLNKDNILTEGASLSYPDSVIDFFKGMIGQPEGGFPKELQKIVLKDIEPITVRPGTLLPDVDFEEIKQHLREKFNMEGFSDFEMEQKAVSYALYPKVYEDYCTHFEAYNDVTTLESHVYFYGLRKGEETVLKVSEGRSILIKFVGMSDPDKDGYRTLTFEVNGILREQKVLDKTLEVLEDRKLKADKNNPCHLGSTIPGTVETVLVKEGDEVKVNQPLMIVEAMKMETTFVSKVNGKVDKLYVAPGDRVNTEDLLISFVLDEEEEK